MKGLFDLVVYEMLNYAQLNFVLLEKRIPRAMRFDPVATELLVRLRQADNKMKLANRKK